MDTSSLLKSISTYILFTVLGSWAALRAQHPAKIDSETEHRISIDFRINSHEVDSGFSGNAAKLSSLHQLIEEIRCNPRLKLSKIIISGHASPDGILYKNQILSQQRAVALLGYIHDRYSIPDSMIQLGENSVAWDTFRDIVTTSNYPWLDEAMCIMLTGSDTDTVDNCMRMTRLKKLSDGIAWATLKREVLPKLRYASVVTTIIADVQPETPAAPVQATEPVEPESDILPMANESDIIPEISQCTYGQWHVATNALEWGLAIANLRGEYDLACRWSIGLSLHYSAWDYATSTRKFRTFILRPDVRYWFNDEHSGLFADAHIQMAAYNFALSRWKYRIQDTGGKHPALGGGIGAGYRITLGYNNRWSAEASIGAGMYHLRYDRFVNRSNGRLVDTKSRTWIGIDNVSLSIVYNFNTAR